MNYFATPVSSFESFNNYNQTVGKGVSLSTIADIEPSFQIFSPQSEKIHLWGIKGDKKTRWVKANIGDILFFYHNKNMISYCTIFNKFENSKLAETLWGSFENIHYSKYTWPLILLLSEPTECHIPFIKFNKIIGYKENYFLRSFFKLPDRFAKYLGDNYSNIKEFASKESTTHKNL